MSSSRPHPAGTPPTEPPVPDQAPGTPSIVFALVERAVWWPILVASSAVWFFFGARMMSRLGPDALAPAAGVMLGTAVGVTLWRWSIRDTRRETLAAGVCPRCSAAISRFEERPRPGALARGLQVWHCEHCGLQDSEPLTPPGSAS